MTTKQEIEIKGLPKGYEVSEVTLHDNFMEIGSEGYVSAVIKLEKIKPREVTFRETEDFRLPQEGELVGNSKGFIGIYRSDLDPYVEYRIWREVRQGE